MTQALTTPNTNETSKYKKCWSIFCSAIVVFDLSILMWMVPWLDGLALGLLIGALFLLKETLT